MVNHGYAFEANTTLKLLDHERQVDMMLICLVVHLWKMSMSVEFVSLKVMLLCCVLEWAVDLIGTVLTKQGDSAKIGFPKELLPIPQLYYLVKGKHVNEIDAIGKWQVSCQITFAIHFMHGNIAISNAFILNDGSPDSFI